MNRKFFLYIALSTLLAGSFLSSRLLRPPSKSGNDTVVKAQRLIDESAGDLNKLAQASDLLQGEVSANPNNLHALFLRGRAFQQRGLLDAARESYAQYFKAKISIDFAANYNSGELYELKGDLPNAEKYFLGCISAAPQEVAGWERLIKVLLKQNRPQEAKEYFDAFAKQSPASDALKRLSAIMP